MIEIFNLMTIIMKYKVIMSVICIIAEVKFVKHFHVKFQNENFIPPPHTQSKIVIQGQHFPLYYMRGGHCHNYQ